MLGTDIELLYTIIAISYKQDHFYNLKVRRAQTQKKALSTKAKLVIYILAFYWELVKMLSQVAHVFSLAFGNLGTVLQLLQHLSPPNGS